MELGLDGRAALVTGGDSGIGFATARTLLDEGARVVLTDMVTDRLEQAATALDSDRLTTAVADLTDPDAVTRLAGAVQHEVGDLDILVSAAGIHGPDGDFHEIDDTGWHETLEANLMSAVRVTRAMLPGLRRGGYGRIVLLSSEDAVQPYEDELPYVVSKAGLNALAKGLSRTYGRDGVLVNTVSPAFIATPMTDEMMRRRAQQNGTDVDEAIASFLDDERPGMVTERRGDPEEVAAVIAFLCSERAGFVTGSNYRVDAGSVRTV
ncbi:MAG: SDR family oxidoreductase [Brachybacterium sp.]|uniref:SDR family NAD(P)-dependent oxidoreductase n=1 Tax=Brachybacterium sp. TaxID=1891286 RepID=UPI002648DDA0|nr:SDR family oxidoreductase [Brachybacterium sp.]MDN5686656.1 SDR family oxidoreductase [Brachybacterium sp.]